MAKSKTCPILGCTKKWRTPSGLQYHLWDGHQKSELAKWIAEHVES